MNPIRTVILMILLSTGLSAYATKPVGIKRYEDGAQKTLFVPKGTWMGGISISYREASADNLNLTVLKNLNGEGYSFDVSPAVGYFFKDNQSLGIRLNYGRTKVDLQNLDLNLGEDFNINLDHIYYITNGYDVSAFWRIYMPIAKSKIFAVFNEARLSYGHSTGKSSTGSGTEYSGTYSKVNDLMLGVAPGITAFITDNAAVEVSVGLMGIGFGWSDQITNQVSDGKRRNMSARFKVDLLSLKLGMVLYM